MTINSSVLRARRRALPVVVTAIVLGFAMPPLMATAADALGGVSNDGHLPMESRGPADDGRRAAHPVRRVVGKLPDGARGYAWRGDRLYEANGVWYKLHGETYIIVSAPVGLIVPLLVGHETSFWIGDTQYFHARGTYYRHDDSSGGYEIVARPDVENPKESGIDVLMKSFVYPALGQSDDQLATDRYECHRWAVGETRYDPLNSDQNWEGRENYDRAHTACLVGRGYAVR